MFTIDIILGVLKNKTILQSKLTTLQEWGNMVIENSRTLTESSKQKTSKGDKGE